MLGPAERLVKHLASVTPATSAAAARRPTSAGRGDRELNQQMLMGSD